MSIRHDVQVLRELAAQYMEIAGLPVQEERRRLWRRHFALQPVERLPIVIHFGMWNLWCRELFDGAGLRCVDPFYRQHEQWLRLQLCQYSTGDDSVQESWITQRATLRFPAQAPWGLPEGHTDSWMAGGAYRLEPPLKSWDDLDKLTVTPHAADEEATRRDVARLEEAVGDILPVNVEYGCGYTTFNADISSSLARLRGLEQVMEDMYDAPEELHRLCAFLRDGVLAAQRQAEAAGHFSLTTQVNQAVAYCDGWEDPAPNSPRPRAALWGFCASQEFTLVSPALFEEFLLPYQLPIMAHWGLVAYGCCEDLTRKIHLLRRFPNLRQIAVTPLADVAACAEQIGTDYAISWRPNPTDMVCAGFDEAKIRPLLRAGLAALRGTHAHINLKDVETLEGDPTRLQRWVQITRDEVEKVAVG